MSQDAVFVFALTVVVGMMMASNRVRYDLIAMIVIVALSVSGVLSVNQALSGFGNSVVIIVAGLLIVGEMLSRTGVASTVGNLILKHGGTNETRLMVLLMIAAGILGSAMSSTAIVAIFIPIVIRIAAKTGLSKSRLLLPMSYAALTSGMLTLIATSPNLVVSNDLVEHGYAPLGFFSFTPIGLIILFSVIAYCVTVGRFILPNKSPVPETSKSSNAIPAVQLAALYGLEDRVHVIRVARPPEVSIKFHEIGPGVRVIARRRQTNKKYIPTIYKEGMDLQIGDQILVVGSRDDVLKLAGRPEFEYLETMTEATGKWRSAGGMADVMIHPESEDIGQPISQREFREKFGVEVVALLRSNELVKSPFEEKLQASDRLLVAGSWFQLDALAARVRDFVVLGTPKERPIIPPAADKFMVSLTILAGMVFLSALNIVPVVIAVILAALAAILFRTMSPEEAYSSIHWSSIVLLAGILPLADALDSTGGSKIVVEAILSQLGNASPRELMAVIFALTAGLGLVLSNTASAVLVIPIAISAAEAMGVSPYPLAITVLIAASSAFSTPVSTPVVTLVVAPGGYSFSDFVKVGLPLTLLIGFLTVMITPVFFPF